MRIPAKPIRSRALLCFAACTLMSAFGAAAQARPAVPQAPPKPPPDVLIFTNGDQLTGTLERGTGDSVIFKSDMAGEITVPLAKIKELHSNSAFAVLRKDMPAKHAVITPGKVEVADGKLSTLPPVGQPEVVPTAMIALVVDAPTYDREIGQKVKPFADWHGAINGGATLVRSTQNGSTYTAGINLVRAIPDVGYLPARNKTTFNLQETYGKLTQPVIPQTTPPTPTSIAVTSIFHADAERDEYFSPRGYGLVETSFDHNFSQGLTLQQVYGAGVGYTPIKNGKQQLDVKVDVHYESQRFQTTSSNQNLIGSTFAETYLRNLPRKLVLTESASVLPAWNNSNAYSANGMIALTMPLLKRFNLNVSSTDNFLNDPAVGFNKNSFQFLTAISYTLK